MGDVRGSLIALVLGACTGSVPPPQTPAKLSPVVGKPAGHAHVVVDPIAALAEAPHGASWIVPGLARLELGGASIQAPPGAEELAVMMFDDQGAMVRVGVKLQHVAFAIWTERARLLGIVAHPQVVSSRPGGEYVPFAEEPIEAKLLPNARVRQLGHKDEWTQIRYLGALEIDGWIPDKAIVERTENTDPPSGRIPTGRQTLMVTPGAVIRSEPQWSARELAVMANGYFVDTIKEIDDAWVEVGYEDGEISVHGYVSKHDPPGRVHKPHEAEVAPALVTPNATIASGTCLYAGDNDEPIGFVIGDRPAELEPGRSPGWFAVTLDTPWGPIVFAARGPSDTSLTACAPAGSVPPPGGTPPAPPPAP